MKIKNVRKMEYFTATDGTKITETFGVPTEGIKEASVAFAILPPTKKTDPHKHVFKEWYVITGGKGAMYINNELQQVTTGDNVFIPEGAWHSIETLGNEALEFYCFCVPAFTLTGTTMRDGSKPKESVERKFG